MKRMTTTKQINEVLSNNLLQVAKAECYHKTSRKTDIITDSFLENFQFLCESGCFVDCIGWTFCRDYRTGQYIIETGRMDGDSENIVIVYLRANNDVNVEDIESALIIEEAEDFAEKV